LALSAPERKKERLFGGKLTHREENVILPLGREKDLGHHKKGSKKSGVLKTQDRTGERKKNPRKAKGERARERGGANKQKVRRGKR